MDPDDLLTMQAVQISYGKARILHDINLRICKQEIVALVGRNGAGKSTTLKGISGLVPAAEGSISFLGDDIRPLKPFEIARRGIGYVPEDRQIFPNLTTLENLKVAQVAGCIGRFTISDIYDLFPNLKARSDTYGQNLSGGEQQMLAISRALLLGPKLLLLDEPTEGLSPLIVEAVIAGLQAAQTAGIAILMVEQNFRFTVRLASRQYVMDGGRIVWEGTTEDFIRHREEVEQNFFN